MRAILRDYVEDRLEWAGVVKVPGGRSGMELLDQLWARTSLVGAQNPGGGDVILTEVTRAIALRVALTLRSNSRLTLSATFSTTRPIPSPSGGVVTPQEAAG